VNILLDLDGTLTDPRVGIVESLKFALSRLGEPCPPDDDLARFIGPPLQLTLGAILGHGSPKIGLAIDLYRQRFSEKGIFENNVYPDMPAALDALAALGAALIVATSKPEAFAERIIEHFGLGKRIHAIYGSELDGTRSDKTELISHVLKAQRISPNSTTMIGDRSHDMIGAKAHGVFGVGALWGYGSREELLTAGASALCEGPALICSVLSSNNRLEDGAIVPALRASARAPQSGR